MFEYLFFLFTDDILIVSCKFIPNAKLLFGQCDELSDCKVKREKCIMALNNSLALTLSSDILIITYTRWNLDTDLFINALVVFLKHFHNSG